MDLILFDFNFDFTDLGYGFDWIEFGLLFWFHWIEFGIGCDLVQFEFNFDLYLI